MDKDASAAPLAIEETKHNHEIQLSEEDRFRLNCQESRLVSSFKAHQIEKDSKKYWDIFYKRNEVRFFKDRHWTTREFVELVSTPTLTKRNLLEVGCGVGNFLYPLLSENPTSFYVYACDFSPRAIHLVKSHPSYDESQVNAFVADITEKDDLETVVPAASLDIVTLIFVLSAIHPQHYDKVVCNLHRALKWNGIILFRDYGLHDMTQLRFKAGHKISENLYMRQDGTRSYFFSLEFVRALFSRNGFSEIETTYVRRRTINKKEGVNVPRIFVQAKYRKATTVWPIDGGNIMFSALKKLTIGSKQDGDIITPPGLQTMSKVLQNKFSKGVQYNMKIIIKGDRNVGKSCLFHRLQGRGFKETYVPTEEIQVTSIQWNYKVTDDVVKVEVWDVVDKGKKRVLSENLKLEIGGGGGGSSSSSSSSNSNSNSNININDNADKTANVVPALDAEFLNVYKGTNGVILVMDITKNWTFEYVQKELEKIPTTIPVLVLGNHCDMSHHRLVTPDHVLYYLETLQRSAPVRYAESSMSNGFGLKFLHKWFNLPFLQLQRETLLAQLVTNENEINITTQELDLYQQTDDQNYKVFVERLTAHRRKVAESNSVAPSSAIVIQTQHSFPSSCVAAKADKNSVLENGGHVSRSEATKKETFLNSGSDKEKEKDIPVTSKLDLSLKNIEEFIPDECLDKSFLEDTSNVTAHGNGKSMPAPEFQQESDSECETDGGGNPLVSAFQDDLDPEDRFNTKYAENDETQRTLGDGGGGDDSQSTEKEWNTTAKISAEDKSKKKKSTKKKQQQQQQSKSTKDDLENFLNSDIDASGYEAL